MWLELEERGTSVRTGEGSISSLQPCKEASSCTVSLSLPLFTQNITAPNAPPPPQRCSQDSLGSPAQERGESPAPYSAVAAKGSRAAILPAGLPAQPHQQPGTPLPLAKPNSTIQRAISQWQKKGTCQEKSEGALPQAADVWGWLGSRPYLLRMPSQTHRYFNQFPKKSGPESPAATPPTLLLPQGKTPRAEACPTRTTQTLPLHKDPSSFQLPHPDPCSPQQDPEPGQTVKARIDPSSHTPKASSRAKQEELLLLLLSTNTPVILASFASQSCCCQGGMLLSLQPQHRSDPTHRKISYRQQRKVASKVLIAVPTVDSKQKEGEAEKAVPGQGRGLELFCSILAGWRRQSGRRASSLKEGKWWRTGRKSY